MRSREDLNRSLLFLCVFKLFCFVKKKERGEEVGGRRECIFFAILALEKVPFAWGSSPFVPDESKTGALFCPFSRLVSLSLSLSRTFYYLIVHLLSNLFSLSLSLFENNRPSLPPPRTRGQRIPSEEEEEVEVKKQPKQRPRNSALRSTVAFDNGLGAGASEEKLFYQKKIVSFFCPSATALRKRRYFCSLSLSFLFHLFSKKK